MDKVPIETADGKLRAVPTPVSAWLFVRLSTSVRICFVEASTRFVRKLTVICGVSPIADCLSRNAIHDRNRRITVCVRAPRTAGFVL